MSRRYRYQALDIHRQLVCGEMQAQSMAELSVLLQQHDLDLLSVRPVAVRRRQKLLRRDLIDFCFHLEQLLVAGISLLDALDDLANGASSKALRELCRTTGNELRSGKPLSAALPEEIHRADASIAGIVHAGEISGRLADTLKRLGNSLRKSEEFADARRQVLTYPLLAASLVLSACSFLLLYVVPQIRDFVSSAVHDLPWYSRLLFVLSDLIRENWLALLVAPLAIILTGVLLLRLVPSWHITWDRYLLRVPLLGDVQRKLVIARLADLLALLYASGVPLLSSLELLPRTINNLALAEALAQVHHKVEQGETLSASFAGPSIFPPLMIRMIETGERTGQLDATLGNLADIYEKEAHAMIGRLQAMIEPALTLSVGVVLGWMMLATLQPIYSIVEQVGR